MMNWWNGWVDDGLIKIDLEVTKRGEATPLFFVAIALVIPDTLSEVFV